MPAPIRVLLVDDDPLVRSGLRLMLGGAPDLEVVAEAADGSEVAALVAEHAPDVVLMDLRMPGTDGLAATEALRAGAPPGPPEVLVLTTFHTDGHVLRALRAGAAGYVLKDTPPQEIVAAVRKVVAGEPVLSPAVTRQLIDRVAGAEPPETALSSRYAHPTAPTDRARARATRAARARALLSLLGAREREVALAVGRGSSNAEIAAELHMSVPTVKTHVSRVLAKLELNNRVQIALMVHDADTDAYTDASGDEKAAGNVDTDPAR